MSIKNDIGELRFWCQKVIPLVYDDSLSYYELLCKVVQKLNEVVDTVNVINNNFSNNLFETVKAILDEWRDNGTLIEIITKLSNSVVNAYLCGIDNTGTKDVADDITNLLAKFTGRKIYFPSGTYKINNPVIMRTDGDYKGNIIVCDSDTKFVTDGVSTMFILGNGNYASTLEKFGFDGGYIDCKNVTETGIMIGNKQYSCVINNLVMRNCGNIKGIQLCTDTTTSSQAYFTNITITGDGSVRGDGLLIYGTDNYLSNINIGRMKRNLVFGGGGNLGTNIHTWNYGKEYEALGINTPEEKLNYPSIVLNGSNNLSNVQVDNGTPALHLTVNAIQNTVSGITFNYEKDFPWGKKTDKCRCINVTGQNSTLGNTFNIDNIVFAPNTNYVSLIKFYAYDRNTTFPFGFHWSAKYRATRPAILRTLECDFARTIYDTTPCLSNNISVTDSTKCCLLGYLGMNLSTMKSVYNFYDINKGEVKVEVTNNSGNVSVTSNLVTPFSDNTSLLFGTKTLTINDFVVVPVYYKPNNTGTRYNSVLVKPVKTPDIFNSFVPFKTPEWIGVPSGTTEVKCYS